MEFVEFENVTQDTICDHIHNTADIFYDAATNANYHRLNLQAALDSQARRMVGLGADEDVLPRKRQTDDDTTAESVPLDVESSLEILARDQVFSRIERLLNRLPFG